MSFNSRFVTFILLNEKYNFFMKSVRLNPNFIYSFDTLRDISFYCLMFFHVPVLNAVLLYCIDQERILTQFKNAYKHIFI